MLTNITLENFKAFQKLDNLKVKPITILCGTNSCGKSSILQSILLLKQTLENKNPNQNLVFNGRFVKLGYFEDIIYQKKEENEIRIEANTSVRIKEWEGSDPSLNVKFSLTLKKTSDANNKLDYRVTSLFINPSTRSSSNDDASTNVSVLLEYVSGDFYDISWKNVPVNNKDIGKERLEIDLTNLCLVSIKSKNGHNILSKDVQKEQFSHLLKFFSAMNVYFTHIYNKYSYIGPLRGEPEREYIYRDEVVEIGNKGENAAYLYLNEKDRLIQNHYFYNNRQDSFNEIDTISIKDALNKWMTLMKIDNFDAETINKIIYLSQNASKFDGTKVGIADVGFGVSQIFPIILEGLRMQKGATLLLEQPEIHLHPNLQMQMADYFIALALSEKQVMVETHSDHVINRLVRRIVEDDTHNLKDLIGIYFVKPTENGSVYEEIIIDDTKGVTNWPVDFFDQTATEQMKIMQAGVRKRKQKRETKINEPVG